MTEKRTKGLNLTHTLAFIDERFSYAQREQVHAELSAELKAKLKRIDTSEWYPVEDQVALQRAIASLASTPEEADALARELGRHLFNAALGTFMRLVVRVLTPPMFFKKTADIWPRMFAFGSFSAEASSTKARTAIMIMRGVEGCDFFPEVSAGFIEQAVAAMGHAEVDVKISPIEDEPEGSYRFVVEWA